ncbi:hypothetical protein QFC21_006940 [Naganishia friedmannii]|uniref:Uncharacterized protein n=1 Tax=Naganishia friedmannii TaxID=89922 RepID=A0ACC2UZ19_9TREE|nr:hypothetical protein QFC21_006940 [Naganishia friedmannii]
MISNTIVGEPSYKNVLPSNFFHGYASASYQIEGGYRQDGRGSSIWDEYLKNQENGNEAVDSYNHWKEDVQLLKQYNSSVYRFSISWSRVKPLGGKNDPVNEGGIEYYNKLIDELLEAGITPWITIYHWDLPLELQNRYNGLATEDTNRIVEDFVSYSQLLFERFGDRVKNWITLNEPLVVTALSSFGLIPKWDARTSPFTHAKNLLLVHGYTVDLYRREFQPNQGGQIGITLNCDWVSPIDDSPEATACAEQSVASVLGWSVSGETLNASRFRANTFTDNGRVNPVLKERFGDTFLDFSPQEWNVIKGSSDFTLVTHNVLMKPVAYSFGLNHYGTKYATGKKLDANKAYDSDATVQDKVAFFFAGNVELTAIGKDGKVIGNRGFNDHPLDVPWGFRDLLRYCWNSYCKSSDIPIVITENGFATDGEAEMSLDEIINDTQRQTYYNGYIKELIEAVRDDGIKISGYMGWSLMDNLEWMFGYAPRFGVTYVDREHDFGRYPKDSTKLLKAIWEHTVGK